MELEGSLKHFSLAELIGMIVFSSVTGVLEVGATSVVGRVYSRDGRIYHAEAGDLTGADAFCQIFEGEAVWFRFTAGATAEAETVWRDPMDLLAQAERRAELWVRVRPYIPSLDCVPVLRTTAPDSRVHVSRAGWDALTQIDGVRSVAEIAAAVGYVPLEMADALVGLVQQGLIAIKPPRGVMLDAPEPGSLAERLLSGPLLRP